MARDTQSIVKMSRREGYALHPKAHKALVKRAAKPGQARKAAVRVAAKPASIPCSCVKSRRLSACMACSRSNSAT